MNAITEPKAGTSAANADAGELRIDFVPTDHYTSPEFLRLEKERLWPRVWQQACRLEELPRVGSFVTYDIMDESIVVVRTSETELKAFYNVCQHRGRRLTEGCGQISQFHCRFHGWQYRLDGTVSRVLDREDWEGCADFADADLSLKPVQVGTWGGWVFVNPDPNAKPLKEFLDAAPHYLDPYEIEKMRFRWCVEVKVPCNWKVGLEAFNESYHVSATHPQLMSTYGDDRTRNRTHGPHGMFYLPGNPDFPMGAPSPRLNQPAPKDLRPMIVEYYDTYNLTLRALFSERDVEATRRLLTEVPPEANFYEIIGKLMEFQREAAIAAGAGWPDITPQQMMEAGTDWHIFPNMVFLPYPDGLLGYRSRPHPTDPDVCFFEVCALQRYAPGAEPPLQKQYMHGDDDWRKFKDISIILQQDFDNMGEVQRGMKSKGFKGARTNPVQEATVSNFHRAILEYFDKGPA
jgi:phenylpropionate dioxygenase-like ring-hydroxylating dioxygenase large terminal subunit